MKNIMLIGKQWLGKFFGLEAPPSGGKRPADSCLGQEDRINVPFPAMLHVGDDSIGAKPLSIPRKEAAPDPGRQEPSPSDGLRESIWACALQRKSVESEMLELCQTYRKSVPPSRLQLFAWAYPKGNPPRTVYWVRLSRRRNEFEQGTFAPIPSRRPRWFKVLKIRTRKDLHDAIHWNGLDKHRANVMAFYDRWWALNRSRSIMANAMRYAKLALKGHLAISEPIEERVPDGLMEPSFTLIEGPGVSLIGLAWRLGRLVEKGRSVLRCLQEDSASLPIRLLCSSDPKQVAPAVEWEHQQTGRRYRVLSERSLRKFALSPQDLESLKRTISECKRLIRLLSKRLRLLSTIESRLVQAYRDARQLLEQSTPLSPIPWVSGY